MKYLAPFLAAVLAFNVMACSKHASRKSTEDTMRRIVTACAQYAEEEPGKFYPPLSSTPGMLAPEPKALVPKYLDKPLDDSTYCYFGYAITSPDQIGPYLNMYMGFVAGAVYPVADYLDPSSNVTIPRLRKGIEQAVADAGTPSSAAPIAVLFARRESYKDQRAPVAFIDGHVEWLAPGQNELIDSIYQIIPELARFKK